MTTTATFKCALSGKRRNPLTGVAEYFGTESALSDILDVNRGTTTATTTFRDPSFMRRRSFRTVAKFMSENSDLKALASAAEETARPKRHKQAGSERVTMPRRKKVMKVEDDDDDDQFVDKDLDAEITTDLL
jgi:hypothetical protein